MNSISIKVFVKEEKEREDHAAGLMNKHMRARARHFVANLEKVLNEHNAEGDVHFHEWPMPQSQKAVITTDGERDYTHLDKPEFDTDIAVCVVPSIDAVDGAIGKLWLRDRQLLHLCLLSAYPIPEWNNKKNIELYRGLLALPAAIKKERNSVILQPIAEYYEKDGIVMPTDDSSRHMTIDSFDKINHEKLINIVDLVQFQKEHS